MRDDPAAVVAVAMRARRDASNPRRASLESVRRVTAMQSAMLHGETLDFPESFAWFTNPSPTMPLPPIVEERLPAIRALCRDLGIAQLWVFGSVARGEWNPQHSDVDFLVGQSWIGTFRSATDGVAGA